MQLLSQMTVLCHDLRSDIPFGTPSQVRADVNYISQRAKHEGLSFFTVWMPLLDRAVLDGIESCRFIPPPGLGHFLSCPLRELFTKSGIWRDPTYDPELGTRQAEALAGIRQLVLIAKRLDLPHSEDVEADAISGFVERVTSTRWQHHGSIANLDYAQIICAHLLRDIEWDDLEPRHGPGVVSTGERPHQKMESLRRVYNDAMWKYFHPASYYVVNHRHYFDVRLGERLCNEVAETAVKLVPKDQRGPRIISAEPLEMQYFQQAVRRKIQPLLQYRSNGRIMFTDQSQNAKMALENSRSREYATIDLSNASDLVSLTLVEWLLERCEPATKEIILNARSVRTRTPDGKSYPILAYAPMGSALCFPIEALSFYCIAVATLVAAGVQPAMARKQVYVYGDDILVPTAYAGSVCQAYQRFGLAPNLGKTFIRGYFRESCGIDAYFGIDVTPVYWRKPLLNGRSRDLLSSWFALSNGLYTHGRWKAAERTKKWIESCYGLQPVLPPLLFERAGGMAFLSFLKGWLPAKISRISTRYQCIQFRVWSRTPRTCKVPDWAGLLDALLKPDPERSRFRTTDKWKKRWVSAG